MKRTLTAFGLCMGLLASAGAVQAQMAGKNVILVHGFQAYQIKDKPGDDALQSNANNYWSGYWGSRAEKVFYWSSAERLAGGVKDKIRTQVLATAQSGLCATGCVVVTHSTGDLVTRYMLKNLNNWLSTAGLPASSFQVLATLDFAGAGGGTEIADIAVGISEGSGIINSVQKWAVEQFMGFSPQQGQVGVLYDLQPNTARNSAIFNGPVPRLRFAGTGSDNAGVTKPFISGADDSVVPLHSACGAASKGAFDSCSKSIQTNGVLTSVSNAPSSLWYNHFVVLMGEKTNHGQAISSSPSGNMATVTNNTSKGGIGVDFADYTESKWWSWGKKVRWVRSGDSYSMSDNVYRTLNN
jgi:hypothetical protein